MPFYAVAIGRVPGIYESWQECCHQVHKFKSAKFKKFKTKDEAQNFILLNRPSSNGIPSSSSSQQITSSPSSTLPLCGNLTKSTQFPSLQSIASTKSFESVIVDKVLRSKRNASLIHQKRSLSTSKAISNKESDDTIIISDTEDECSMSSTRNRRHSTIKEDSVILIDDDLVESPKISSNKKVKKKTPKTSSNFIKSTESNANNHRAKTRSSDFIPLIRETKDNENRSENVASKRDANRARNLGHVVVYTDGACSNNGYANAKAGIGVWWGENDARNLSEPLEGKPTNNRAEIWAAIKAIERAAEDGYDSITVCSDSDFLIKSAKFWVFKWKQNGWLLPNKKKVANKEDFIRLIQAMEKIKVIWEKVKSHIGIPGNEHADQLANQAIGVIAKNPSKIRKTASKTK